MTLTFLTNMVNHHQIPVADELYKRFGNDYVYVAFESLPDWIKENGYQQIERPYILHAYESEGKYALAESLAKSSDIVVIGAASESLIKARMFENKITFHYSERWFKKVSFRLLSPRLWCFLFMNHIRFRNKRSYMLCASAFTATDVNRVFAYPDKCFKWGYFTQVPELNVEELLVKKRNTHIKIMWCARFLKLKHPELAIQLAKYLKDKRYNFELNMFGSGEELEKIKALTAKLDVDDVVTFQGNRPNNEILHTMQEHHIFLFTSDRNEGWGAVLNEAMSNGCTVVGSDEIGSVPFLINDGVNGCVFKSEDIKSLISKVDFLINNPEKCEEYARNGYESMRNMWSPENAAKQLVKLLESALVGNMENNGIITGPCSKA